jgi:hypothetical protein
MVDANPHIAIIHESRWIPDFYHDRVGMTPAGRVSRDLIPPLLEHKRFPNLEMSREDLEGLVPNGSLVLYPRFVAAVFDLYAKRRDKRLAGDKTPSYVRSIPALHALFPEAKFVHIIRDVCLSAINWRSGGELPASYTRSKKSIPARSQESPSLQNKKQKAESEALKAEAC